MYPRPHGRVHPRDLHLRPHGRAHPRPHDRVRGRLHSLDGFLGNGVNAVHQRHYLFVRGIDRIKDCLDPGIGIAADVDEEITFGNRNHIARCRFKRVTFRTRGKQHVEIEMIAADGAQKIILRKNRSHGGEFRVLLGIRRLF